MHESFSVSIPPAGLVGDLIVPDGHEAIIIFVHGSGSSRRSAGDLHMAHVLADAGFGALLLDLLTEDEARDQVSVLNIDLLADRVLAAIDWIRAQPRYRSIRLGLLGSGTGVAAAIKAAALRPAAIFCLVSRSGRVDLAGEHLRRLKAPTLLIVGGEDEPAVGSNSKALPLLGGGCRLSIVPGATHLFEEPGAMDAVIKLAIDWFSSH